MDITLNLDQALELASHPKRGCASRTVGALSAALIMFHNMRPNGGTLRSETLDVIEELTQQIQDMIELLRESQREEDNAGTSEGDI